MKVIILAGGFGTRLSEYTETVPKPMVSIGGRLFCGILCAHMPTLDIRIFIWHWVIKPIKLRNIFYTIIDQSTQILRSI